MPVLWSGAKRVAWEAEGLDGRRVGAWVKASCRAVAAWYGALPDDVDLQVVAEPGDTVRFGLAEQGHPPQVTVWVGQDVAAADLREDWVLTHELLHTGSPGLPDGSAWLAEGLATYAEPLARARAGLRNEGEAWSALRAALPQGNVGRGPLTGTRSWARRYWGGALWCFAADVRLRQATQGEVGLDLAQGRLAAAGGTYRSHWHEADVVAALDDVTQTRVFSDLHASHALREARFDVEALWDEAIEVGLVA